MMKKQMKTVLILAACLLLTACSGKKKDISVDVQKLADDLNAQTISSDTDTLSQTATDMLPAIYYLDAETVESAAAYMSGGATACEIAVIESKEEAGTKTVEEKLKKRVSSQSDLYASYNADEVSRLKEAVIKSAGRYTVLVVCDDTKKANEILKSCGF